MKEDTGLGWDTTKIQLLQMTIGGSKRLREKARPTNQEQISEIEVDMDKERTNDVDDFDKEHFINSDDEGSDESDDPHDMGSLMFSKSSLKRQL
ncbi:hypothetical protein T459_01187 [Capsicum annuum]|uniref:Uncharacterized protein n=1 Tax=Capsicum annuum TaxID=4072 RepID=A0A2G3AGD8_CAPAN|nr:hypothetical protein T459_01187 [Capsicum annuum]